MSENVSAVCVFMMRFRHGTNLFSPSVLRVVDLFLRKEATLPSCVKSTTSGN